MDEEDAVLTTSSRLLRPRERRYAGGKLHNPPSRRPPPTPYVRPQQNQAQRTRWLSKLVDPACRLISGGATLIFPSFFSKSLSKNDGLEEEEEEEDHDKLVTDVERNASGDNGNLSLNPIASRSTGVAGTSRVADGSKSSFDSDRQKSQQEINMPDQNGFSKIEQLMKDKRFSRDEVNHLIELIRSRGADLPDNKQENYYSSVIAEDVRGSDVALGYSNKSSEEKHEDLNRAIIGTSKIRQKKILSVHAGDVGRPAVGLENSRKSTEEKHEDLNAAIWGTSAPWLKSTLQDDVGASPVEIARAYMQNRTLEVGSGSKSLISKDEGTLPHGNVLASKPRILSPSSMSSACWPGAVVRDQRGYMTPQTQRGRFGLHTFPRTPYSRTIYSKSKSKLLGDSDSYRNTMSTPFQQAQTSAYGRVNSRAKALDEGHGSVGPIRRMRHKVVEETPPGSSYFHSSLSSQVESLNISEGLSSGVKLNLEQGRTSSSKFLLLDGKPEISDDSVPNVPPHSRQMARKILEHLERNPATPKDKSTEVMLAISWKKPQSSDESAIISNKPNSSSLLHLGGLDSSKRSDQVDKKNLVSWSEERGKSLFKVPQEASNEVIDAAENNTSASGMKVGRAVLARGDEAGPSLDFRKSSDSNFMTSHEGVSKVVPNATGSAVISLQKKPPSHSSGTKPVLPSLSVCKPEQRWTFSPDKSSGFTFPVSASPAVFSEPPTPSILPSSSASGLSLPKDGALIPSYSFSSKRSTPALVFSFPSTSNAPTHDASDLKFNFGSDKTRISFGSIGKDAFCY